MSLGKVNRYSTKPGVYKATDQVQDDAPDRWSRLVDQRDRENEKYHAADLALRKIAGFLASRRRWGFVSVRRAEAELQKATEPLAEAVKDPDSRRQKTAVERGRLRG